jgi:hypothetical protein
MMSPRILRPRRAAIEIALWRHGWVWLLTSALLCATASTYFLQLRPRQIASTLLDQELAHMRRTITTRSEAASMPAVQSEPQRLISLQDVLRHSPKAGEIVRRMVTLAQAENIHLAQSDYQRRFHDGIQVSQVQITQPVRATYPQLRRYTEAVLRGMPQVSLDQVTVRREAVGQIQVEARLTWSLWTQAAAPVISAPRPEATP